MEIKNILHGDIILKKDEHIIEVCKTKVIISDGKVVHVDEPEIKFCPLRAAFYGEEEENRTRIQASVEKKIRKYGYFTENRSLEYNDEDVPFGASEMLMDAMELQMVDAVVCVCDGAGTVIVTQPEIVQGIGARMTGLIKTSPITRTIEKLEEAKSIVVFPDTAKIDQAEGVRKAFELDFKRVAVTFSGEDAEKIEKSREYEKRFGGELTVLAIHTTGITKEQAMILTEQCDLVWGCASKYVRSIVGPKSLIQVGLGIPVFVLTKLGKKLVLNRILETNNLLITRSKMPKLIDKKQPFPLF